MIEPARSDVASATGDYKENRPPSSLGCPTPLEFATQRRNNEHNRDRKCRRGYIHHRIRPDEVVRLLSGPGRDYPNG